MNVLVFDTETTGLLPKLCDLTKETLHLFPYIVQISWIVFDLQAMKIAKKKDFIIKLPNNILIPQECINIHGITNEMSQENGENLVNVIEEFIEDFNSSDKIVAHNLQFDLKLLRIEIMRIIHSSKNAERVKNNKKFLETKHESSKLFCTMQHSIDLCGIKAVNKFGREYKKFPKLVELHYHLFNESPKNLHNSLNDVIICLRCFYYMNYKTDILHVNEELKNLYLELLN